ncbi:hypothetical protein SEA_LUCKYSOCKE_45 [Streptomyces phage LuckySocke]|nr:hypothetical protein SEA_LUCKYSOCKE_45 [Streptomyces phage LuckySocke]
MSRTYKDRPHWVRRNDPTTEKYASHDHLITCREKVGEEPVMRRALSKDGWHWEDEVWYTRPLFKRWTEKVPCTLHVPEEGPSNHWRKTYNRTNEEKRNNKNCFFNLEYYPGGPSGKVFKRLTHGAERSKIRQQLQVALNTHSHWWDDGEWDDVDIHNDSKYASRGWWDW